MPTWADSIIQWMTGDGAIAIVSTLITLTEVGMRKWPTAKPWSLLIPIKYALLSLSTIFTWVAKSLLDPLIQFQQNTLTPPKT